MGGNIAYKSNNYISTTRDVNMVNRKVKEEITKEDLFQKLMGKDFCFKNYKTDFTELN